MVLRILSADAIAALAGATMLALSNGPSYAFILASPTLERSVAAASIEPVYWHHWHHWGWHHWGWHHWHHWGWHDWHHWY